MSELGQRRRTKCWETMFRPLRVPKLRSKSLSSLEGAGSRGSPKPQRPRDSGLHLSSPFVPPLSSFWGGGPYHQKKNKLRVSDTTHESKEGLGPVLLDSPCALTTPTLIMVCPLPLVPDPQARSARGSGRPQRPGPRRLTVHHVSSGLSCPPPLSCPRKVPSACCLPYPRGRFHFPPPPPPGLKYTPGHSQILGREPGFWLASAFSLRTNSSPPPSTHTWLARSPLFLLDRSLILAG